MITRIAPTPSGFLHAGNAVNFLLIEKIAKITGSRILLRIDDLDMERTRQEYLQDIFDSLHWLGIEWHMGPRSVEEHIANWSQTSRISRYAQLLDRLRALGVLYACTCSRSRMDRAEHLACKRGDHDLDDPAAAWRIRIREGTMVGMRDLQGGISSFDVAALIGDTTLRQRPIGGSVCLPAYQIASLADDIDRNVSLIVRGADLLPSTAVQLHLASLLGLDHFLRISFWHHPLIKDEDGRKLSKSDGSASLKAMRESGAGTEELRLIADRLFDQMKPIA